MNEFLMADLYEFAKNIMAIVGGLCCASLALLFWCLARAAAKEAPKPVQPPVQIVYQGYWRDCPWFDRMDGEMEEFCAQQKQRRQL